MAARTGSTPRPSNQIPAAPPTLTDALARQIAQTPRRMNPLRRSTAAGEVWLQSDEAGDGWIRARVIEAGLGFLGLLVHHAPPIGRGTWARIALSAELDSDAEQVRILPLAVHALGETQAGPMFIECEIPADPALLARFLR